MIDFSLDVDIIYLEGFEVYNLDSVKTFTKIISCFY